MLKLYEKHYVNKEYTSIGLFRAIKEKYHPERVLYPGCFVHITPSFVFSDVTYVDSFRNTDKFFEDEEIEELVEENKEYEEEAKYTFFHQDYYKDLNGVNIKSFDVVIFQYAGFIGKAVKKYLKFGGYLVCNNSHGDASMSSLDPEYELFAVYNKVK